MPDQRHSSGLVLYRVTLDSFDVDTRIVRSHAQVLFSKVPVKAEETRSNGYPEPFYCQSDEPFRVDLFNAKVFIGFGGMPQFFDLGRSFSQSGLRVIQDVEPLGPCDPAEPGSGFVTHNLLAQAELFAIGDPKKFPFDRYLVIYRMWCPVLVQRPDGKYLGVLGFNQIDNRLAGFSMRYPSPQEIETWATPVFVDAGRPRVRYQEEMWAGRQVAVILERGLFVRAIAVFLALVVLGYLCWIAVMREARTWFPDILGFFLTVWAIRGALSVGAPKVATVIDYSALCFYVGFIGVFLWKVARGRQTAKSGR